MLLKRRIPSAGPQIWIRSSLLILRRSAPTRRPAENLPTAEGCFCPLMKRASSTFKDNYVSVADPYVRIMSPLFILLIPVLTRPSQPWMHRLCGYLRSWRRAVRKVRTCDGAATAECPAVRTMAQGATCQKEEEPLQ